MQHNVEDGAPQQANLPIFPLLMLTGKQPSWRPGSTSLSLSLSLWVSPAPNLSQHGIIRLTKPFFQYHPEQG